MFILTWIVAGVVSGLIAFKLLDDDGGGSIRYVSLGVVGAIGAGWAQSMFRVQTFDVWTLFVPVVGAVILLVAFHFVRGRPVKDASRRRRRR